MKKIFDNPMVRFSVAIILLFTVAAFFMEPLQLKRYMDAGRIGIYSVLLVVMLEVAWTSYWAGAKTGKERVAVALAYLSFIILFQATWVPLRREVALPDWLAEGHMGSAIVLGYVLAGVGFLLPIGNSVGITPPRNYWFIAAAGVVGGLVAGVMIGLGIQASPS